MTNFTFMWLSVLSIMIGWVVGYYAPEYLLLVLPAYVGCVVKFFGKIETITEKEATKRFSRKMNLANSDGHNLDVIIGGKHD